MELFVSAVIILICGYLGGKAAGKLGFPRITGYLIAGVCLNPSISPIIPKNNLETLNIITPIVLGMISYTIGGGLRLDALQRLRKGIAGITLFQALGPFALSFALIFMIGPFLHILPGADIFKAYLPMALTLGAISMSSAPAAIVAIVHECRSRGPVTTTCFAVLALTDMITVVVFALILGFAQPMALGGETSSLYRIIVLPILHIFFSLGTGVLFGWALIFTIRRNLNSLPLLFVTAAVILACTFIAENLGLSSILANMAAGFIAVNRTDNESTLSVLERIEEPPFLFFFAINGMSFDFQAMEAAGILTVLVIVGRKTGKYLGARFGAWLAGAPEEIRKYPGLVILPKAGLTLGLAFMAQKAFPSFGTVVFNALVMSTIINMLVTPPLAKYAIIKAGENRG